jgi:hypothetical protein
MARGLQGLFDRVDTEIACCESYCQLARDSRLPGAGKSDEYYQCRWSRAYHVS